MVADHAAEPAALLAGVRERLRGSSLTYAGAATQMVTEAGSRPACGRRLADRLDHPLGQERVGELEDEPVGLRGRPGPAPWGRRRPSRRAACPSRHPGQPHRGAVHDGLAALGEVPDGGRWPRRAGRGCWALRPATRIAESPRPMPQTVRLPYISLRVAKVEAVTSQVRVPGLVTIGPTVSCVGVGQDAAVDDERLLPQHGGVEGPAVAEAVALGAAHEADERRSRAGRSAGRVRSPSLALQFRLRRSSCVSSGTGRCRAARSARGRRGRCTSRRSMTVSPRESTVSTRPVIRLPS